MQKRLHISIAIIITLLLAGCASSSEKCRNITASYKFTKPLKTPLKENIRLARVITDKNQPLTLTDHMFRTSLADSLKNNNLLNESDEAEYVLSAEMQYLTHKQEKNETYIQTSVYYKLKRASTNTKIWTDYIETKAYYKDTKGFFKTKKTMQQSIQNNLNTLMEKLTNFRT